MAGYVNAHIYLEGNANGAMIDPDVCPAKDQHRETAYTIDPALRPRCFQNTYAAGARYCPYFIAATQHANVTLRLDVYGMEADLILDGKGSGRCGVLCQAQRRNRPPGV